MKSLFLSLCFTTLLPAQQELVDELLQERDPAKFEPLYAKASKAGVARQALLETRFLYLVDQGDEAGLATFSKELEAHLPKLNIEDSVIFSTPEDYRAIVEYTKALGAIQRGKQGEFKKHITEAFWLSPGQAQIFGRHIENLRVKELKAKLIVDLTMTLAPQKKDETAKSIKAHLGEAPAMVLNFWTPWSRESMDSLENFVSISATLKEHKLPVISVLLAGNAEARKAGDEFLEEDGSKIESQWLVDSEKGSLATLLRVRAFPTVVLVKADGSILFHGHPVHPNFWKELKALKPNLKPPTQ